MSDTPPGADSLGQLQYTVGTALAPWLVSGGVPAVPSSSLTLPSTATVAWVLGTGSPSVGLQYVSQSAHTVGPLNSGNGTYWTLLYQDRSSTVAGWTRQPGTSYLWQYNPTTPATPPGGMLLAMLTVSGGAITAVQRIAKGVPSRYIPGTDVTSLGVVGDGATDNTARLNDALRSANNLYFPPGTYLTGPVTLSQHTHITLAAGASLQTNGAVGDMITSVGWNLDIIGSDSEGSQILPKTGYSAIRLAGNWSVGHPLGAAQFRCARIGFHGGLHAVNADAPPPTGFEEGLFVVEECFFTAQTDYALYIGPSVFYTFLSENHAYNTYGFADIYDNTETKIYGNVVEVSATGATAYRLTGCQHVVIDGDEIAGGRDGNPSPDILIVPAAPGGTITAVPGSGTLNIIHVKFANELDQSLLIRPKIQISNPASDVGTIGMHITQSWFNANNGMGVSSVSRASNVATATIVLPVVPRADGETYTSHHATVGSVVHLGGILTNVDLNGEFTVTAVTATTLSWASTGADIPSVATPSGVVYSGFQRAILLQNRLGASTIAFNDFQAFSYIVDDSTTTAAAPYGTSDLNVFYGNTGAGPLNRRLLSGTRSGIFGEFHPGVASPYVDSRSTPHLQPLQTRNRIPNSDLTTWTKDNVSVVPGVDSGFGSLTGYTVSRSSALNAFSYVFNGSTHQGEWTLVVGASVKLELSALPNGSNAMLQLRASGTTVSGVVTTTATVGVIDKTHKRLLCCYSINLFPDRWTDHPIRLPFSYYNDTDLTNTWAFIIPGDWLVRPGIINVANVAVSDLPCDYLSTSGSALVDSTLANIWPRDVAIGGLRTMLGDPGVAPTLAVTDGSLGTGGTATFLLAGNSVSGTILLNTGVSPTYVGYVVLTIHRPLGLPMIVLTLESAIAQWELGASVILQSRASGSTYDFQIRWNNHLADGTPTPLPGSTANCLRINYWIAQTTTNGLI